MCRIDAYTSEHAGNSAKFPGRACGPDKDVNVRQ